MSRLELEAACRRSCTLSLARLAPEHGGWWRCRVAASPSAQWREEAVLIPGHQETVNYRLPGNVRPARYQVDTEAGM